MNQSKEHQHILFRPLDQNNAIALRFLGEDVYLKASLLAHSLEFDEIHFPGRNTIIINRALVPRFEEFKNDFVLEVVVNGASVSSERMNRLRRGRFGGMLWHQST